MEAGELVDFAGRMSFAPCTWDRCVCRCLHVCTQAICGKRAWRQCLQLTRHRPATKPATSKLPGTAQDDDAHNRIMQYRPITGGKTMRF